MPFTRLDGALQRLWWEGGTNISPDRCVLIPIPHPHKHLLHKVAHGCPGIAGNIQESLDILSSTNGQNHLGI